MRPLFLCLLRLRRDTGLFVRRSKGREIYIFFRLANFSINFLTP
jgi:hypothetical protein